MHPAAQAWVGWSHRPTKTCRNGLTGLIAFTLSCSLVQYEGSSEDPERLTPPESLDEKEDERSKRRRRGDCGRQDVLSGSKAIGPLRRDARSGRDQEVGHLRRCASKAPAATAIVCPKHALAAADGVVSTSERREQRHRTVACWTSSLVQRGQAGRASQPMRYRASRHGNARPHVGK